MPADPGMVAAYRDALDKAGVTVTVTRINGFAPNAVTVKAENIRAIVRADTPNTTETAQGGYATTRMGAMTEGDRVVILMAADLAALNFPLPVKKNDRITLFDDAGNEVDVLNVTTVDAYKRAAAGAIELKAAGVQ